VVSDLAQRGIGFKSLQENLDTTTSSGKLVSHMFGALAEFERDLIRERTQAGLTAARARDRLGGRPRGLSRQAEATALAAETLYREGQLSVQQIAEKLHIAKSTMAQGGLHRSWLLCVVYKRWVMPWRPRRPLRWGHQSTHTKESLCARRLYPN
jgi:DNA invertase Pin-like site-specific DNA recombinase